MFLSFFDNAPGGNAAEIFCVISAAG